MQFQIIAYDGKDDGALERRMAVRANHFEYAEAMKARGQALMGGAILDENGQMIGSTMIVEFPNREGVEAWLAEEPYVVGQVWQDITILPYQVAPLFQPAVV